MADNTAELGEVDSLLTRLRAEVDTWRASGRGWFEDGLIKKKLPNLIPATDEKGKPLFVLNADGTPLLGRNRQPVPKLMLDPVNPVAYRYFGPYRYFRWYEDGKMKTRYFGRVDRLEAVSKRGD